MRDLMTITEEMAAQLHLTIKKGNTGYYLYTGTELEMVCPSADTLHFYLLGKLS